MNSRLCISAPKLRTQHCIGSNQHIDRGWNRLRPRFAGRGQCRCWVIRDQFGTFAQSPLYPQHRTSAKRAGTSVSCHNRTHASQQAASLFDHLVCAQ